MNTLEQQGFPQQPPNTLVIINIPQLEEKRHWKQISPHELGNTKPQVQSTIVKYFKKNEHQEREAINTTNSHKKY